MANGNDSRVKSVASMTPQERAKLDLDRFSSERRVFEKKMKEEGVQEAFDSPLGMEIHRKGRRENLYALRKSQDAEGFANFVKTTRSNPGRFEQLRGWASSQGFTPGPHPKGSKDDMEELERALRYAYQRQLDNPPTDEDVLQAGMQK